MSASFRQLQHARALARHGNFRLAAREIHISQPALTRSIKALEQAVGARLFDRLPAGVTPTPAGELFLERALRVLREGEDLEHAMGDLLGLTRGSLVVSTGPYPGDALVPDAVAALMRQAPDLHCHIREADWVDVASHLLERKSDLAVADISGVEKDERFATELLNTDSLHFVCRSRHPLAGKGEVNYEEFGPYPLVGNRVPGHIARSLAKPGAEDASEAGPFRVKIDVATFAAAKRILLASDGITLAPLAQVASELRDASMSVLPTQLTTARMHSGLIHLKGRSLSPAATRFVTELHRIKAGIDAGIADLRARYGPG
jgi:DNA-binding transcriptional LysR family regulator